MKSIFYSTVLIMCYAFTASVSAQNRVGIETLQPEAGLHVGGVDGLLISGVYNTGAVIEASGPGTRLFFNPRKSAFRAGSVTSTKWDNVLAELYFIPYVLGVL